MAQQTAAGLTAAQLEQFRESGFFVLQSAFSAEETDALTQTIDPFVDRFEAQLREAKDTGISRPNEISFTVHLARQDPHIAAFVRNPTFVQITSQLIGPDVSLYWDQAVYKHPETPRDFPWHQDNGYTSIVPEQYVTCWLALTDATVENGCIWAIPGSHKQGTQPHRETPIGQQGYFGEDPGVPLPISKGSMIVFSSLLFHRSGPNLSDGTRKAYIIQYSHANARKITIGEPLNNPVVVEHGTAV